MGRRRREGKTRVGMTSTGELEPKRAVPGVSVMNSVAMWADEPSGEVEVVAAILPNFVDFYRDERDPVARAVAMTIGDLVLAKEAVDEAMTRAYARWSTVQTLDNPGGWVYRVALNWSRSVTRRVRRPQRAPRQASWSAEPSAPEPTVAAALASLSHDQRAVIVCRHLLGWSEQQTADALNIRPGTVKSRSSRAIQSLQTRLAHLNPEASP